MDKFRTALGQTRPTAVAKERDRVKEMLLKDSQIITYKPPLASVAVICTSECFLGQILIRTRLKVFSLFHFSLNVPLGRSGVDKRELKTRLSFFHCSEIRVLHLKGDSVYKCQRCLKNSRLEAI